MTNMLLQRRHLLRQGISQGISHHMSTINIIMSIVLLTLGYLRMLTWQEPHVQLSAALDAKAGFYIMSYPGSIHKRHIQCLSHMPGSHHVGSVGIYQGIAVDFLFSGISLATQLLIVIIL